MKRKFSEKELQDPEMWDSEHVELREPVKAPRAIVSVAFRHTEFEVVGKAAERHGQKVSEFIREAALDKATGRVLMGSYASGGGFGASWYMPNDANYAFSRASASPGGDPELFPVGAH